MSIAELFKQTKDPQVMKKWADIIEKYSKKLSDDDYCKFNDEIYESIFGEVLPEEKAEKIVNQMKPYGQKWTISEVDKVLSGDWKPSTKYFVMNMMYNDYHELLNEDTDSYIKMSKLWLEDEDYPNSGDVKTYRYATKV